MVPEEDGRHGGRATANARSQAYRERRKAEGLKEFRAKAHADHLDGLKEIAVLAYRTGDLQAAALHFANPTPMAVGPARGPGAYLGGLAQALNGLPSASFANALRGEGHLTIVEISSKVAGPDHVASYLVFAESLVDDVDPLRWPSSYGRSHGEDMPGVLVTVFAEEACFGSPGTADGQDRFEQLMAYRQAGWDVADASSVERIVRSLHAGAVLVAALARGRTCFWFPDLPVAWGAENYGHHIKALTNLVTKQFGLPSRIVNFNGARSLLERGGPLALAPWLRLLAEKAHADGVPKPARLLGRLQRVKVTVVAERAAPTA